MENKNKEISDLTQEQIDMIPAYIDDWVYNRVFNTTDINREMCEKYLKYVCALDKDYPTEFKIVYLDSPLAVQYYINMYILKLSGIEITFDNFKKHLSYMPISYYANINNYVWMSTYKFFEEKIGVVEDNFKEYSDLFLAANIYQFAKLPDTVVVSRKPTSILFDDNKRLHSYTEPAVTWADGTKQYYIKGIKVPEHFITDKVKLEDIENEEDAELRRIAMELYGYKEYMIDSNAEKIDSNEWGELWKKEIEDDEPIVMVSVLNSTPEPDACEGLEQRLEFRETEIVNRGKWFKRYLLRVHPETTTVLSALAQINRKTVTDITDRLKFES